MRSAEVNLSWQTHGTRPITCLINTAHILLIQHFGPIVAGTMHHMQNFFRMKEVFEAAIGNSTSNQETECSKLWNFACQYNITGFLSSCHDFVLSRKGLEATLQFGSEESISELSSNGLHTAAVSALRMLTHI